MHKDLAKLLKLIEGEGATWKRTKGGHIMVFDRDGRPVTTFSGTPSDHRSWRNSLSALRRAGFTVPR